MLLILTSFLFYARFSRSAINMHQTQACLFGSCRLMHEGRAKAKCPLPRLNTRLFWSRDPPNKVWNDLDVIGPRRVHWVSDSRGVTVSKSLQL